MPVNYKVVQRFHPMRKDEPRKWYALAHTYRQVGVVELCENIASHTTFTRADLIGAIEAFLAEIITQLKAGNRVNLGSLGNMRPTLKTGTPTVTQEEFSGSCIKVCHILFWPGKDLRDALKVMLYNRVSDKDAVLVSEPLEDEDSGE